MIRKAIEKDFNDIVEMAREFWVHTQFSEKFDSFHVKSMVSTCHDHELLIVAEDEEGIFGFMAAIKSPLLGSRMAQMATELAWWINPEKRGNMASVRLVQFLERLCIEQEVKYLNLAYMQSSMPEKVKAMYEKMGYTLQECCYTKVLIHGSDNISSSNSSRNSIFGK